MIDCLPCLRTPAHAVDLGDGETVEFCETCWRAVESRLDELGREYRGMLASGVHPRMAERAMNEALERSG